MKREDVALSLQAVMSLEAFGNPEEIIFFSPGGYADIMIVDGNPLDTLDALIRDNVKYVTKDCETYKNAL